MSLLSSFGISIAAGVAIESVKLFKSSNIETQIKNSFEEAIKEFYGNERIPEIGRVEIRQIIKSNLTNPESSPITLYKNKKYGKFFSIFNASIAKRQEAYNYLKEIKDYQRYNSLISGLERIEDMLKQLVETINSPIIAETQQKELIKMVFTNIEYLKPSIAISNLEKFEKIFKENRFANIDLITAKIQLLKEENTLRRMNRDQRCFNEAICANQIAYNSCKEINDQKSFNKLSEALKDNHKKVLEELEKISHNGVKLNQKPDSNRQNLVKYLTLIVPSLDQNNIVGRQLEIERLHQSLFTGKSALLVNGIGGMGKTTIVQTYIGSFKNDYSHIVWVEFKDNEDFKSGLINSPGLLESLCVSNENTTNEVFNNLVLKLRSITSEKPSLIVLDNLQNLPNEFTHFAERYNWHLLATSRRQIDSLEQVDLTTLSSEETFLLFKKHYKRQELDDTSIKALLKLVEYHTLTIEIMAKMANSRGYNFDKLSNALNNNLTANVKVAHSKRGQVKRVTSYLNSIFSLSDLDQLEIQALKRLSCSPSGYQNLDFIAELWSPNGSDSYHDFLGAIDQLSEKGWVYIVYTNENVKVYLHQVIRDVVLHSQKFNFIDLEKYIDNIIEILTSNDLEVGNTVFEVSKFIQFGISLEYVIQNKLIPKKVAKEIKIAKFRSCLANILRAKGDFIGAKKLLEKVIISYEKNLGKRNYLTCTQHSKLGAVLLDLGENEKAHSIFKDVILYNEKLIGENYSGASLDYSNLGTAQMMLGYFTRAMNSFEKAIQLGEKEGGSEGSRVFVAYTNLASTLMQRGDYKKAKELSIMTMSHFESKFGEMHPLTGTAYSNLGLLLKDLGDYIGAREYLEKTVENNENNFEENHPLTAQGMANLASVLINLEDFETAKKLLERAVLLDEKNDRFESLSTAVHYSLLAQVLRHFEDFDRARLLLEKAKLSNEKNLGINHHETARTYSNLALALSDLGYNEKAIYFLEKALESDKENFGKNHIRVASRCFNLGSTYLNLEEHLKSASFYKEAYTIYRSTFGSDHLNTKAALAHYWMVMDKLRSQY